MERKRFRSRLKSFLCFCVVIVVISVFCAWGKNKEGTNMEENLTPTDSSLYFRMKSLLHRMQSVKMLRK